MLDFLLLPYLGVSIRSLSGTLRRLGLPIHPSDQISYQAHFDQGGKYGSISFISVITPIAAELIKESSLQALEAQVR